MQHSPGDTPAFADDDMQAGITVWQYYKAEALGALLSNPNTSAENGDFRMLGQTVTEIAEAVADAAVAGDAKRNEGGE